MSGFFRKLVSRGLDPSRVDRVYREYDVERGYAAHHELCRRVASRPSTADSADLVREGFDVVAAMSESEARALLASITDGAALSGLKKDSPDLEGYRIAPDRVPSLLAAALSPEVDRRIAGAFESEYLVHWFTVTRTPPADRQASVSFRWHCDRGPRAHLKLLVYLNGTEEHGGNTELLDLDDSAAVARAGYPFGSSKRREEDLAELARIAGRPLRPRRRSLRAGEALLFHPSRVLHRGVSPTTGPRFVLTLCLLPSPVPWQEALGRGVLSDLASDEKWHEHASEIVAGLGQTARDESSVARREVR